MRVEGQLFPGSIKVFSTVGTFNVEGWIEAKPKQGLRDGAVKVTARSGKRGAGADAGAGGQARERRRCRVAGAGAHASALCRAHAEALSCSTGARENQVVSAGHGGDGAGGRDTVGGWRGGEARLLGGSERPRQAQSRHDNGLTQTPLLQPGAHGFLLNRESIPQRAIQPIVSLTGVGAVRRFAFACI